MKEVLGNNQTAQAFTDDMKKAFPGLPGEAGLEELSKALYGLPGEAGLEELSKALYK